MSTPPVLTDRTALIRNRARATRDIAAFLHEAAMDEIDDRLAMVNKTFTAPALVTGFPDLWQPRFPTALCAPDQDHLTLREGAHDLVIHAMGLHWANDLVGQLIQCRRALRPDGLFLAVFFGGETLAQLRAALGQAEADVTGGLSPRIAPMGEIRDLGGLLQRAGFALPVADSLPLRVSYASPTALMHDLRRMGEGNALNGRLRHFSRPAVLRRAADLYHDTYADADGRIPATFELMFLTGWSPADSQPKPLRPGAARTRLADALGTPEHPLKD